MKLQIWRRSGHLRLTFLAVGVVFGSAGCSGVTEPAMSIGTFVASVFRYGAVGEPPINVLDAGGSLELTIAEDSSTSGLLKLPAVVTGNEAMVVNMAGRAIIRGDSLRFEQSASSFVRSMYWRLSGNELRYEKTEDGIALSVVLTRRR